MTDATDTTQAVQSWREQRDRRALAIARAVADHREPDTFTVLAFVAADAAFTEAVEHAQGANA